MLSTIFSFREESNKMIWEHFDSTDKLIKNLEERYLWTFLKETEKEQSSYQDTIKKWEKEYKSYAKVAEEKVGLIEKTKAKFDKLIGTLDEKKAAFEKGAENYK